MAGILPEYAATYQLSLNTQLSTLTVLGASSNLLREARCLGDRAETEVTNSASVTSFESSFASKTT